MPSGNLYAISRTTISSSGRKRRDASSCACSEKRGFHVRKRRALLTTHTELKLMAAAAIMGLSVRPAHENAPAATGMQIAL